MNSPEPARGRRALDREIFALALPAFATLVSEPLLILADSAIIGHLSTTSLAGLGVAANVIGLLIGLSVFLAYGTTATVARRLGAGDRSGALATGLDGMLLGLALGIVLAGVLALAAGTITGWYPIEAAVQGQATIYLRIVGCGLPAVLVMLASTGVLRGLQDTRTPLYVAVAANVINVGLNLTLVYGVGWGIAGSAIGTVLAQTGASAFLAVKVIRAAAAQGVRLRFRPRPVLAAARSGSWLIMRTAELQLAITTTTVIASRLGAVPLAAHQIVYGIWNLLALGLDAIAIAGQAIVGRWLGAAQADRVRATTRRMIMWGAVAGGGFGLIMVAARPLYVGWFTPDPGVQQLVGQVIIAFAVVAPINGIVFVLDGVLIGAGDARYLALSGLAAVIVYLPLAFTVNALGAGLVWLWVGYCGYMVARLITLVLRYRTDGWLRVGVS